MLLLERLLRVVRRAREELVVDLGLVETRHRAAVQPQRARGQHQVGTLQRAVAAGGDFGQLGLVDEPGARVGMREQLRQVVVEAAVVADHRDHRRLHRLLGVARRQRRQQPLLGLGRAQEEDACRAAVGAGRAPFHQLVELEQQVVADGLVEPDVVRPGAAEQLVECLVVQGVVHVDLLRVFKRDGRRAPQPGRGQRPPLRQASDGPQGPPDVQPQFSCVTNLVFR